MSTENFQMYEMDLEKAEEPEIKLLSFIGSKKKQRKSIKISTSASLIMLVFDCITTNWKILKEMGVTDHLTCLLRNLYAGQEATVRIRHGICSIRAYSSWFLGTYLFLIGR